MNDNDISYRDYRNQIEQTAEIIVDQFEEYDDDYSEVIFENVDSHQWMIYDSYSLDVLRHTDEGPQEWSAYVEEGETDHWRVLNAMAFTAFRADVRAKVTDLRSDD
jgi:aminoglycoside phosphotransferase family enzyme